MSKRRFPILSKWQWERDVQDKTLMDKCPRSIPWSLIAPHEEQAQYNHDQSLQKLASRGGLDPVEMWCILHDKRVRRLSEASISIDDAIKYLIEVVDGSQAVEHRSRV